MPKGTMHFYSIPKEYLKDYITETEPLKYEVLCILDDKGWHVYPFKRIDRFMEKVEFPKNYKPTEDSLPLSVIVEHHYKSKVRITAQNSENYVKNFLRYAAKATYIGKAQERLLEVIENTPLKK